MNSTIASVLERALVRSGDDLYRLALLLAPDTVGGEKALIKAIRRLAISGPAPDDHTLIAALVAALPPEQRRRPTRPPAWARPAAIGASHAPLLQAIARLPRQQRLALGLTMLRGFDPAQAAPLLGGDEAAAREQVRDALLALAPIANPEIALATLDPALAPEECRPTRAALALSDPQLHTDAAVRGHLALCAACRSAEQSWLKLTRAVEQALRGALREVRLPAALAEQLQAAAEPELASTGQALLANPRARLALVALLVLVLIAFLVWPRGAAPTATSGRTAAAPSAPALLDLVRRARDQLYTPPNGAGVWHSRYEFQWFFPNNSFAPLTGEQWVDPASGRHRAQLIHRAGGGPYEFELADGASTAWYAIGAAYAPSLYPLNFDSSMSRVEIEATPAEQRELLQARLQSGAWSLADSYLRQATTAELRSWGRQHAADGALLDLIGFSGVSPLALPPDAPNATTSQVTILLAIDEDSGRLREVRELLGAAGSEQTARTTWRIVTDEWITDKVAIDRVFDLQQAWNGIGAFVKHGKLANPALPLVGPNALTRLAVGVRLFWTGFWLPASPPFGTTSALLVNRGETPANPNSFPEDGQLTFVYLGVGRRLEVSTTHSANPLPPLVGGEVSTLNGQQITLLPTDGQGYQAQISHSGPFGNQVYTTQIEAAGYTRAEFLAVLRTLGPPTVAAYRAQARLFANPQPHDAAAFEALLGALAPASTDGARHFVERVFKRQDHAPDPLADPYHRPRYGGWPEQAIQDNWNRGDDASGTAERMSITRSDTGTIYHKQYLSAAVVWYYDAPTSQFTQYPGNILSPEQQSNEDQNTILRMLACGGAKLLTRTDGTRAVTLSEDNWRVESCQNPSYPYLFSSQTNPGPDSSADQIPYLADQGEASLTTLIDLSPDGRAVRTQVWAGSPESGTLLESWELLSDEQVPLAQVPVSAFDAKPPEALIRSVYSQQAPDQRPEPHTVTITEALQLAQAPLFGLPETAISSRPPSTGSDVSIREISLDNVTAGAPPATHDGRSYTAQDTVFDRALKDGYAIRLTYTISQTGSAQTLRLYEGPANVFGLYLRGAAQWKSSAAANLQINGKQVNGWAVIVPHGNINWLLFELDGTLIAVEEPYSAMPNFVMMTAIAELQPIDKLTR